MSEEEFDSIWDDITIMNPCISWEICACDLSMVCIWPYGKAARVFPICPDCEESMYTTVVFATNN